MTTNVEEHSIDLDSALEIVTQVVQQMRLINGSWPEGEGRAFSSNQAALTRDLLNISDQLILASSLVKNEYWSVKGETSYEF